MNRCEFQTQALERHRRANPIQPFALLILAFCMLFLSSSLALGATSFQLTLPNGPPPPGQIPSGLQLRLESYWVEGSGYRPVTVELRSLIPSRATRTVHVRLSPNNWQDRRRGVEFDLELPQGATQAATTVLVPQTIYWQAMQTIVTEEGRFVYDLCTNTSLGRVSSNYTWTEAHPTMLFVDSDAPAPSELSARMARAGGTNPTYTLPDLNNLLSLLPRFDPYVQNRINSLGVTNLQETTLPRMSDDEVLRATEALTNVGLLPPRSLPTDWRAYSSVDLIFISQEDLRMLVHRHPESYRAIRDHVTAGGTLIVMAEHEIVSDDSGETFSRLTELDQLLSSGMDTRSTSSDVHTRWRRLVPDSYGKSLETLLHQNADSYRYGMPFGGAFAVTNPPTTDSTTTEGDEKKAIDIPPARSDRFRVRNWDLGRVVAMKGLELDVSPTQWSWLLEDLGEDRWRWFRRMGISWSRDNTDFWDFMIPGVGAAPVTAFLAIITGFVIVIGPVNYVLLSRWKRLYLLLVTVPFCAAVITSLLLGYALVRDGLGSQARIMSFSEQTRDGRVASWSRQTYYSGVAPSGGLIYPNTATVFPIDASQQHRDELPRLISVGESTQRLESGYIQSRTMSQNLVVNVTEASPSVEISVNKEGTIEVVNRINQPLAAIVVYHEGKVYLAENVSPGGKNASSAQATEVLSAEQLTSRIRALLAPLEPRIPTGFATPTRTNWNYYSSWDNGQAPPSLFSNIMSRAMQEGISGRTLGGRVWVAITREAPEFVPVGIPSAKQTTGVHFIRGYW